MTEKPGLKQGLYEFYQKYRTVFLSGVIAGLFAHMFVCTNKLVNADEINSLFGKGATWSSGRWGIELFKFIFPEYSMPWLWGIVSILFISLAVCLAVDILKIQDRKLQLLLAAVTTTFPSVTGLMCFMFTSSIFAFSFLLAVFSVWLFEKNPWTAKALAALCLILSLGIYQAYVSVAAGFFVLMMLRDTMDPDGDAKTIFIDGVKRVGLLLVSLVVYYIISLICVKASGQQFESYAFETSSIIHRLAVACSAFLHTFTRGYFCFISTTLSRVVNICLFILFFSVATVLVLRKRKTALTVLYLFLAAIFPVSLYSIYLMAETGIIHSLVLFSFVVLYYYIAVVAEKWMGIYPQKKLGYRAAMVLLTLVCITNAYFANKVYLKMYLDYENAYSMFTSISTQIRSTPGYDENTEIAIIGDMEDDLPADEAFDDQFKQFIAASDNLINVYTRMDYLRYYIGCDYKTAGTDEINQIKESEEFKEMAVYPYYDSIRKIGNVIVVKLSE